MGLYHCNLYHESYIWEQCDRIMHRHMSHMSQQVTMWIMGPVLIGWESIRCRLQTKIPIIGLADCEQEIFCCQRRFLLYKWFSVNTHWYGIGYRKEAQQSRGIDTDKRKYFFFYKLSTILRGLMSKKLSVTSIYCWPGWIKSRNLWTKFINRAKIEGNPINFLAIIA